jgi:hypothetical protein
MTSVNETGDYMIKDLSKALNSVNIKEFNFATSGLAEPRKYWLSLLEKLIKSSSIHSEKMKNMIRIVLELIKFEKTLPTKPGRTVDQIDAPLLFSPTKFDPHRKRSISTKASRKISDKFKTPVSSKTGKSKLITEVKKSEDEQHEPAIDVNENANDDENVQLHSDVEKDVSDEGELSDGEIDRRVRVATLRSMSILKTRSEKPVQSGAMLNKLNTLIASTLVTELGDNELHERTTELMRYRIVNGAKVGTDYRSSYAENKTLTKLIHGNLELPLKLVTTTKVDVTTKDIDPISEEYQRLTQENFLDTVAATYTLMFPIMLQFGFGREIVDTVEVADGCVGWFSLLDFLASQNTSSSRRLQPGAKIDVTTVQPLTDKGGARKLIHIAKEYGREKEGLLKLFRANASLSKGHRNACLDMIETLIQVQIEARMLELSKSHPQNLSIHKSYKEKQNQVQLETHGSYSDPRTYVEKYPIGMDELLRIVESYGLDAGSQDLKKFGRNIKNSLRKGEGSLGQANLGEIQTKNTFAKNVTFNQIKKSVIDILKLKHKFRVFGEDGKSTSLDLEETLKTKLKMNDKNIQWTLAILTKRIIQHACDATQVPHSLTVKSTGESKQNDSNYRSNTSTRGGRRKSSGRGGRGGRS